MGGELLTIEAVMMPGKGKMTVTGNLRDVMKESISAASSYVRSRSTEIGVKPTGVRQEGHPRPCTRRRDAERRSICRVAMVTAITSVLTGIPIDARLP